VSGTGEQRKGEERRRALARVVSESVDPAGPRSTRTFQMACECRGSGCGRTLEIRPEQYVALRAAPRRYAVHPDHVSAVDESVVREYVTFVVVEGASTGRRRPAPSYIEAERRRWLGLLVDACDRVSLQELDPSDRYLDTLLEDVAQLRARLLAELQTY
jgi:hypothetical protein